jgi:DNA polymerase
VILHIDFETRSELDLRKVGIYNYARHPSTDVWCMAYAYADEEPSVWAPGAPFPMRVGTNEKTDVFAHNAAFELAIWNEILAKRYRWPPLSPEQTHCTMAMCYAMALPGALDDAAMALGLPQRKDKEGRALMLKMASPISKPGQPVKWKDDLESRQRLYAYCCQDVVVERAIHKRLMPLSANERRVWLMDYEINQRGVCADIESAKAGVALTEAVQARLDKEMGLATNGAAQTCTALIPIKQWLSERGLPEALEGLDKTVVLDALARDDLAPEVKRVLLLRQEAGKTSTAKLTPMIDIAGPDNRLRNMYQYHGAATGRWAGRKVQVHNLPRDVPPTSVVDAVLKHVRNGDYEFIDMVYGAPLSMLSRCLRGFLVPAPGHVLIGGDFASVESRGVAWFCGEEWKLKAFREADAGKGPGVYEMVYGRMRGVPPESVKNPSNERQEGKVSDLAFGYQGGKGSIMAMAKLYNVPMTEELGEESKVLWRDAHPKVVNTWYDLQRASIAAVKNPGAVFAVGVAGRQAKYKMSGSFLWCLLPSGRAICYAYPKIRRSAHLHVRAAREHHGQGQDHRRPAQRTALGTHEYLRGSAVEQHRARLLPRPAGRCHAANGRRGAAHA